MERKLNLSTLETIDTNFQELFTNIQCIQQFEMLRKTKERKAYPMPHIIHHFVYNRFLFL